MAAQRYHSHLKEAVEAETIRVNRLRRAAMIVTFSFLMAIILFLDLSTELTSVLAPKAGTPDSAALGKTNAAVAFHLTAEASLAAHSQPEVGLDLGTASDWTTDASSALNSKSATGTAPTAPTAAAALKHTSGTVRDGKAAAQVDAAPSALLTAQAPEEAGGP